MALRPVNGPRRVGPHALERDADPQGPLAAGLDQRVRRLTQDGGVAGQQLGTLVPELEQPALRPADLFAGVEAPGDVDRRRPPTVVARSSMTASPPFMSEEPTPQRVSPSSRGVVVGAGRHGVEVAGQDQALGTPETPSGPPRCRPTRSTVSQRSTARAPSRRRSAMAASSWLTEGIGHQLGRRRQKVARRGIVRCWRRGRAARR